MNEAKALAYTTLYRDDGLQINITHRSDEDSLDAAMELMSTCDMLLDGTPEHTFSINKPNRSVPRNTDKPAPIQPDEIDDVEPEATGDFPRDWGLVDYMPKASELSPNDTLRIEIDEYEYKPNDEIRFYKEGDKYPQLTHNMSADYPREQFEEIFKGWEPDANERKPFPKGSVILHVQCSQNLNKAGNPYRNLVNISRPE